MDLNTTLRKSYDTQSLIMRTLFALNPDTNMPISTNFIVSTDGIGGLIWMNPFQNLSTAGPGVGYLPSTLFSLQSNVSSLQSNVSSLSSYITTLGSGSGIKDIELVSTFNQSPLFSTIAFGYLAGADTQAAGAIAIGSSAGYSNQAEYGIGLGYSAARLSQQNNAIAIGYQAGLSSQKVNAVAIGTNAGNSAQALEAIAIGFEAGQSNQAISATALGSRAGWSNQGAAAIAIGNDAGFHTQRSYTTAIGYRAGNSNQGSASIAIGASAGYANQAPSSIVLSALTSTLNVVNSGFYVAPLRSTQTTYTHDLGYNANTAEIGTVPKNYMNLVISSLGPADVQMSLQDNGKFFYFTSTTGNTVYMPATASNGWNVYVSLNSNVDAGYLTLDGTSPGGFDYLIPGAKGYLASDGTNFYFM